MKLDLAERLVYIIAILNIIVLFFRLGICEQPDTESYVQAWNESLSQGRLDLLRTPVYPIFLGFGRLLAGEYFGWVCVIVQQIIFLISIFYFKKLISMVVSSEKIALWIMLCYAIFPVTSGWGNILLTESLAVTGLVFFAYHMLSYMKSKQISSIFWSTGLLLFLILLRPAFVYLIPVSFLFWIISIKEKYPNAWWGCAAVVLVSLCELGYCYQFKKQFGLFAPSSVSVINMSYLGFQDGLMHPEYTNCTEYKAYITEHNGTNDPWTVCLDAIDKFGHFEVNQSVKKSMNDLPSEWIDHTIKRFETVSKMRYNISYVVSNPISSVFRISFLIVFIFLAIYAIFIVYYGFRRSRIPLISIMLWSIITGCIITSIIGAQSDWGRLTAPSFSIFLCMVGQTITYLNVKR